MKGRIVVDVAELGFDAERAEGGEGVIAQVAVLASYENDFHDPRLLGTGLGGQLQGLPYLDDRAVEAVCPLEGLHACPDVA